MSPKKIIVNGPSNGGGLPILMDTVSIYFPVYVNIFIPFIYRLN